MPNKINLVEIAANLGPEFAKHCAQLDDTDGFIGPNYDGLRAAGVLSALVPLAYGGGGASHPEMCKFIRSIAHSCPSTALALSMHQHLVGAAVANDMAGRPGRPLLDKVVGSKLLLISTGANDWLDSNGTMTKVDGGYKVTAVKPFASGGPAGDVLMTSATYDDPTDGPQVMHFPVPMTSDGISFMDDWQVHGMRATGSQSVRLDDVFVPDASIALIRQRGAFHPAFAVVLTVANPLIMSAYVGVAEAAAEVARNRAKERTSDPVTPYLIGEMENLLTTAQIVHADMIHLANNLEFTPTVELASQMMVRKTICAKHVIATCEKALEATGGAGYFRKIGLERLLRDAHAAQFHPLPEKRQQLFTGRVSMGLDAVSFGQSPARQKAS